MGEKTSFNTKIDKVNHPYIQIVVALTAMIGTGGGATAFFQYKSDKVAEQSKVEQAKLERTKELLELRYEVADLKSQIAASVLLVAAQGKQIKTLVGAMSMRKNEARRAVESIDIPMTQGQPILGGRAIDLEEHEKQKAEIKAKLKTLTPESSLSEPLR